jgi:hypothetical protein
MKFVMRYVPDQLVIASCVEQPVVLKSEEVIKPAVPKVEMPKVRVCVGGLYLQADGHPATACQATN